MSFMDRTITVTDEEYRTIMSALDVTAARYEGLAQEQPHMVPRARKMRETYQSLLRYMENQLLAEDPDS
jgi:hypothetical protein